MFDYDPKIKLERLGWALHALGGLVVMVASAVGMALLIHPLVEARREAERDLERVHVLLSKAESVGREHQALKDRMDLLKSQKSLLRKRITDGANEAEFLSQLSEMAAEVELLVREYRPGNAAKDGEYGTLRIDLVCEGNYQSLCRFLDRINELPRLARIQRLDVASASRGQPYPIKIALDIYFVVPRAAEEKRGQDA